MHDLRYDPEPEHAALSICSTADSGADLTFLLHSNSLSEPDTELSPGSTSSIPLGIVYAALCQDPSAPARYTSQPQTLLACDGHTYGFSSPLMTDPGAHGSCETTSEYKAIEKEHPHHFTRTGFSQIVEIINGQPEDPGARPNLTGFVYEGGPDLFVAFQSFPQLTTAHVRVYNMRTDVEKTGQNLTLVYPDGYAQYLPKWVRACSMSKTNDGVQQVVAAHDQAQKHLAPVAG